MNSKWIITIAIASLFVGFIGGSLDWTPTAQGQLPEKAAAWEYTVRSFYAADTHKSYNQQLNELSGQGWEYVGILHMNDERRESTVAFRRVKK